MIKLSEAKQTLIAPLAGRSRAAATLKMKDIVKAQQHRDEVYKRWASLYKQQYDPTPTTFRTKPAKVRRQETDISKSNGRTLKGGQAGGSYNNKTHTINVTTSKTTPVKNLENIGFHEGIHSYGLGESPSYQWKTKYLNFPKGTNSYNLDSAKVDVSMNITATTTSGTYLYKKYSQDIISIDKNTVPKKLTGSTEDTEFDLRLIKNNTQIIVESIFPVDDRWDLRTNSINNTKINNINYLLAQMAEQVGDDKKRLKQIQEGLGERGVPRENIDN